MSKKGIPIVVLFFLLGVIACLGGTKDSVAGMDVSVNIGLPPAVVVPSPPHLVVIPGTYVYAAPDVGVNILFYQGHWYRPHDGRWFRADSYNGPWMHVHKVPIALSSLPPGYHRIPPGHRRIPYGQVQANWKKWEREKHWHKDRDWREVTRDHDERGKGHHEEGGRGHGHGRGGG